MVDPSGKGSIRPGALDGVLDPQIAALLERVAPERLTTQVAGLPAPKSDAQELVSLVKGLPFRVVGPAETDHAQVMRGGLLTSQFDPATLGARTCDQLFACGEALDIDADCGGFNLAWAWKSGIVAGNAAAASALLRRNA
jgi:predicted flavoprotein YhiN